MFLRASTRKKDGKEHRYFSVVENKRVSGGRVLQRHVLYLGEINSSQELAWRRSIEVLDKGTRFDRVLFVLVAYRLLSPGSEWRLHRHRFERSALGDLLGGDAALADIHTLYACHDRLLEHKQAVFDHLVSRWRDLFNASFDVLLYDLTSTDFEFHPPAHDEEKH